MIVANSERLILREVQDSDFEFLFNLFNDSEVMKFYDGLRTPEQTRSWMQYTYEIIADTVTENGSFNERRIVVYLDIAVY